MRNPDRRLAWHRLAPGVYDDGVGGLHLVAEELLRANGYADTPANRATLIAAARDKLAGSDTEVIVEE